MFGCRFTASCALLSVLFGVTHQLTADETPKATTPPADAAAAAALPGHSTHGEAFDEGPRQKAYLMGGTGKVHFPVTTRDPAAQQYFDQGVGQLHGFWYFEAERSFRQVLLLDPDCAIAYWGLAMANVNNEKRAKAFAEQAVKHKKDLGRHESLWIDAISKYYTDEPKDAKGKTKDRKGREQRYIRDLEAIVQEFPADLDAKAFLAYRIWDSRGVLPISSRQAVDSLLELIFQAEPAHPANHYRIHLWDDEKPERALSAAAGCGPAAPSIAHMWHMPGHTYSKLLRYQDAVYQQEAAARVDHAHTMRVQVMPYQIHNYAHNNEWCVRNLVNVGRVRDAVTLSKNMVELPRHPQQNMPGKAETVAGFGRVRLLDALSLYELTDECLALCEQGYFASGDAAADEIQRLRCLGVIYFAKGNAEQGAAQLAALEAKQKALDAERDAAEQRAETKALEERKNETEIQAAKKAASQPFAGRRKPLEQAVAHVRAQQAETAGDFKRALELFAAAGGQRKEHEAQRRLKAGEREKAEQLAKQAVDAGKEQVYPLATYVEILYRLDKKAESKTAFETLRTLAVQADLDTPIFARLAPIAAEFGYPADWRAPRTTPADIGARPNLESLGPLAWQPSAAADWTLQTADDKNVSLADYRGRPVIVIFYLGFGCLHCIEQLNAFAPLAQQYEDAGISLIAISTDNEDDLRKSVDKCKTPGGFPFPLVSDTNLSTFQAYRAYDDFERTPLHATFLIDGQGRVRWQDIGAGPFTDAKFLFEEAQRLLKNGR